MSDAELKPVSDDRHAGELVARELGPETAAEFDRLWRAEEDWRREQFPGEGLRERKKRLTRQRISDVATTLFIARGFAEVTVAQIAEIVGVSEKTIYNYFPTKESLVFDQADEEIDKLAQALRERDPHVSPTRAILDALKADTSRMWRSMDAGNLDFVLALGTMIRDAPTLRAAWADHRHRLVEAATETLAADAGVDPRDPEPILAARALVSLQELFYESYARRIREGHTGAALRRAVADDLERGARLLDTGLWSLNLLMQGARTRDQLREAAQAAQRTHKQVLSALREARTAWRMLREQGADRPPGADPAPPGAQASRRTTPRA